MSIVDSRIIDQVGIDRESGAVVLMITDHLPWDNNEQQHLLLLQEKLNAYLRFAESGEIFKDYPQARDRLIVFEVVGKHPLTPTAVEFYGAAATAVRGAGFDLRFELFGLS